jgi:hypothetical protein
MIASTFRNDMLCVIYSLLMVYLIDKTETDVGWFQDEIRYGQYLQSNSILYLYGWVVNVHFTDKEQ